MIWVMPERAVPFWLWPVATTSTGVLWVKGVRPLPSWPLPPYPQHLTPPEVVRAQVLAPPAVIWVALKFQAEAPGPVKVPVPWSKVTPSGSVPALTWKRLAPDPPVMIAGRSVLADPVTNRWVK